MNATIPLAKGAGGCSIGLAIMAMKTMRMLHPPTPPL